MIDALLSTGPLAAGTATPLAQASFTDVERFRAAMMSSQSAPPAATLEATSTAAANAAATATALPRTELATPGASASAVSKPSLGETILGGMQDLSADTRQRYAQIGEVLAKPNLNMSDLMSLQFSLLQTSLQFEIASKGISKLTQNLDSVLKTQ